MLLVGVNKGAGRQPVQWSSSRKISAPALSVLPREHQLGPSNAIGLQFITRTIHRGSILESAPLRRQHIAFASGATELLEVNSTHQTALMEPAQDASASQVTYSFRQLQLDTDRQDVCDICADVCESLTLTQRPRSLTAPPRCRQAQSP